MNERLEAKRYLLEVNDKKSTTLTSLVRKVKEETGLIIEAKRLLLIGTSDDRHFMEFIVDAKLKGGTFKASSEVCDIKWVSEKQDEPILDGERHILTTASNLEQNEVGYYQIRW